MKTIKLLMLCVVCVFFGYFSGVSAEELHLVGEENIHPFVYKEDGKDAGIDIDILREMEKRSGFRIKIEVGPFKRVIETIKSGRVDGGFPLFHKKEREEFLTYVFPLHYSTFYYFVKPGKEFSYNDIRDLYGKNIGMLRGYTISEEFDKAREEGMFSVFEMKRYDQLILMTERGRIDTFPGNEIITKFHLKKLGKKLTILKKKLKTHSASLVLSKPNNTGEVYKKLKATLEEMKEDGTIQKITDKYIK